MIDKKIDKNIIQTDKNQIFPNQTGKNQRKKRQTFVNLAFDNQLLKSR
ncbi:MAG TPA: hypothetical protein V6C65_01245 [Allocoleopsis sp.]